MKTMFLWIIGIVLFAFALGACSSTTPIVSEWRNPARASSAFLVANSTIQRWSEKHAKLSEKSDDV
jgi:hypothetical protein